MKLSAVGGLKEYQSAENVRTKHAETRGIFKDKRNDNFISSAEFEKEKSPITTDYESQSELECRQREEEGAGERLFVDDSSAIGDKALFFYSGSRSGANRGNVYRSPGSF